MATAEDGASIHRAQEWQDSFQKEDNISEGPELGKEVSNAGILRD